MFGKVKRLPDTKGVDLASGYFLLETHAMAIPRKSAFLSSLLLVTLCFALLITALDDDEWSVHAGEFERVVLWPAGRGSAATMAATTGGALYGHLTPRALDSWVHEKHDSIVWNDRLRLPLGVGWHRVVPRNAVGRELRTLSLRAALRSDGAWAVQTELSWGVMAQEEEDGPPEGLADSQSFLAAALRASGVGEALACIWAEGPSWLTRTRPTGFLASFLPRNASECVRARACV
jgi:hypothetical protein